MATTMRTEQEEAQRNYMRGYNAANREKDSAKQLAYDAGRLNGLHEAKDAIDAMIIALDRSAH